MTGEKVVVAVDSSNEAKLEAVRSACALIFGGKVTITSCTVISDVSRQPFGDRECKQGAMKRAMYAADEYSNADYSVGIENGICDLRGTFFDRAWVAVRGKTDGWSYASSASIMIPPAVAQYLHEHPDDGLGRLLNRTYTRKEVDVKEEYAGLATNNVLDRTLVLTQAVICAFAPLVNPLFFDKLEGAVKKPTRQ